MATLENERLRLECTAKAGEMTSLVDKATGTELLYQRDGAWKDSNPTLFPIVGNTYSGKYEVYGKTYEMKNHGLIRYAQLTEAEGGDSIKYEYEPNDQDLARYPYHFKYTIEYRLDASKVIIDYTIENTDDRDLPFTFGLHPAFRVPQKPGEKFEDYKLVYSPAGPAVQMLFKDADEITEKAVVLDEWPLDRKDIRDHATLIYKDIKTEKATLMYKDEPRLSVQFPGFPYLAIWTHETPSDFLCIEPWYGHADLVKKEVDFAGREGMMSLEPGGTWKTSYTIEAEE